MALYNFLKQAKAYVVTSTNNKYRIDISNVSFSQTFKETSRKVKTLHSQDMFEASVINQANPANFELVVPAIQEDDNSVIFDKLLDSSTFDLYVETDGNKFKLEKCVITNARFNIQKRETLSMDVKGQASKLSIVSSIPGTLQTRSSSTTFQHTKHIQITLGGTDITEYVASLGLEIQSAVKWNSYLTVHGAIDATSHTNTMYPSNFTISKKILAGSIQRFLTTDSDSDTQTWQSDTSLNIKAGEISNSTLTQGFEFDITNCSFTNRLSVGDAFTQNYDWRMTENPSSLSNIITYITN